MTDDGAVCRTPACRTPITLGYAPRGLCSWCETRGAEAIDALCDDWDQLQPLVWDKQRGGLGEVGGGKFGPSEPINYAADSLAREIAYTAVQWETVVRERARLAAIPEVAQPTYDDLARATRTLAAHYTALVATPPTDLLDYDGNPATADGPDAIVALAALHRRARNMVGLTSREETLPGVCSVDDCGREMLRHRVGSNTVRCGNCGATWTWDEYQDAVSIVPIGRAA